MIKNLKCHECSPGETASSRNPPDRNVHENGVRDPAEKAGFISRRIFMSYGHDEHQSLAERLNRDLKARGHLTWFDKDRLRAGHDWQSEVEQGLGWLAADKSRSAVLLLLTPHSVRRPSGYCLNEIARAVDLNLRIVPLMVVESEPPLSICRIQWLDMRDCIPISEKEASYVPKFAEILKALEESRLDFECTQNRLLRVLNPIQFSADISRLLRDFSGRRWVFAEVDAWLRKPSGEKIFWLTGAPGVGKSSIAAWLRDNRREIAAFHFCDINSEEKRNPARLVRSLVYQLSTQLPDYQRRLARLPLEDIVHGEHEAYTLFDQLLIQPLAEDFPKPDRTIVVLVDALDEATCQGQNEVVRFLALCADKTPPWMRFLVTSRPEPDILSSFQGLSPHLLDANRAENVEDLRSYLQTRFSGITPDQIETILDRSEGVFLYIKHVHDGIRDGHLSMQDLGKFPRGLGASYKSFFDRQFQNDSKFYEEAITPLLYPILAAFEPLTLGFLKRLCGFANNTDLLRRLNRFGSLFPTSGQGDADNIRPFHRSICDWITVNQSAYPYYIDAAHGHRVLADCGWREYVRGTEGMDDYFVQWLPSHLRVLGEDERQVHLLMDFCYLMQKARRQMTEKLVQDFRDLPSHLTSGNEMLGTEAAFFRERAHILRRGSEEWPTYKLMLQLAVEHADQSPLTTGAEKWLKDGQCDWLWLRRNVRLTCAPLNPCLATLEGHTNGVNGVAPLADGRLLSWSDDNTLRLWDNRGGRWLAALQGHTGGVKGALELPDGRLISWSEDRTLRLWDTRRGACLRTLQGHVGGINGALATPGGRLLSWSEDRTLRLWDTRRGACLKALQGHTGEVTGALVTPDQLLLSWSLLDDTLRLWDRESGKCIATLNRHARGVKGALVLDKSRLLSWSLDNTLRVWNSRSGLCLAILHGHTRSVNGALVLNDGRLLSWSRDNTLRLWDIGRGTCLATLRGHTSRVDGALALPDGRLLSWSKDDTIRLWDNRNGGCLATLHGHTSRINGVLALLGGRVVSWSDDGTLCLWESMSGKCLATLQGHSREINGARSLADGRLLSWSSDSTLRLWDSKSSVCTTSLQGHKSWIGGILALADGRALSWSDDTTLRLWDSENGACAANLKGHTSEVNGALALPGGRLLSWSNDKTLRIWDSQSGTCLVTLEGHLREVTGALTLGDARLLSWSRDSTLRLWNSRNGACLASLKGHTNWVNGALPLGDGQIVSWSDDRTLRVWDSRSNKCLGTLHGHTDDVWGAFVLADRRLLSWSRDHTLRLWNTCTGMCLATLQGHTHEVWGAVELTDGRLLSWSRDKKLRLWDTRSGVSLATLQGHRGEIKGALPLSDEQLLSWSEDGTFRLWNSQSGACLEVIPEEKVASLRPEWVYARAKVSNPASVAGQFCILSSVRTVQLLLQTMPIAVARWSTDVDVRTHALLPDGTAVATQANGQVCILKLYAGKRRVSLVEAQAILAR